MADNQVSKVGGLLHDLEEDARYKALAESGTDLRFERFRQDVGSLRTDCFKANTTVEHIRHELKSVQAECFGTLAPFRPFLTRALVTLDS